MNTLTTPHGDASYVDIKHLEGDKMTVVEIVTDLDELISKSNDDIRWQLRESPRVFGTDSFYLTITTLGKAGQIISFTKSRRKKCDWFDTNTYSGRITRLKRYIDEARKPNWRGRINMERIASLTKELEEQETYLANTIEEEKKNKKYNLGLKKQLMEIVDKISLSKLAKKGIWRAE
jgi:hypothetical protein